MPLDASQLTFAKQLLKAFRDEYGMRHNLSLTRPIAGIQDAVLTLVTTIEAAAHPDDLVTTSPDRAQVTETSRLGDHLYITRKHFGLTV